MSRPKMTEEEKQKAYELGWQLHWVYKHEGKKSWQWRSNKYGEQWDKLHQQIAADRRVVSKSYDFANRLF
jgi:hypothetical protein